MSETVIEPTRVYNPGTGRRSFYETYNTRTITPPAPDYQPPGFDYRGSWTYRQFQKVPNGSSIRVQTPQGFPKFLGARPVIFFMWVLAMVMVSLDEWHQYHVLPRPARLWYTTLTYLLLGAVSTIDAMVPITNLLAIGFTIRVGYNYYTGNGGFGGFGPGEVNASTQKGGTNAGG